MDLISIIPLLINVLLGGIVVYKFVKGETEAKKKEKFIKEAKDVLDFIKNSSKLQNLSKFIELSINVASSDKLNDNNVNQIISFVKATIGI